MTDRQALEKLLKAVWHYAKEHDEAYVRLMLAAKEVDTAISIDNSLPPIALAPDRQPDKE